MVLAGVVVGGFGWLRVVVGGCGWFWFVPPFSMYFNSLGFGDSIDAQLAREHRGANGAAVYAINTDFQVGIEMEDIIKSNNKLQGKETTALAYF